MPSRGTSTWYSNDLFPHPPTPPQPAAHAQQNNNGTVLNGPPVVSLAPLYELPAAPAGYLSIEPTPTETDIASGLTLSGSFDAAYFGGAAWDAKSVSEFKAGADAGSFYLNLHTAEYNKTPWGVLRGDIVSAPLSACAGLYVEEPATPTTNTRTRRLLQL